MGADEERQFGRMESTLDHLGEKISDVADMMREDRTATGEFRVEIRDSMTRLTTEFNAHKEQDETRFSALEENNKPHSIVPIAAGGAGGLAGLMAALDHFFGLFRNQ